MGKVSARCRSSGKPITSPPSGEIAQCRPDTLPYNRICANDFLDAQQAKSAPNGGYFGCAGSAASAQLTTAGPLGAVSLDSSQATVKVEDAATARLVTAVGDITARSR